MAYTPKVEWDAAKNEENERKHGVSLEEASELFVTGIDFLEFYDESTQTQRIGSSRLAGYRVASSWWRGPSVKRMSFG